MSCVIVNCRDSQDDTHDRMMTCDKFAKICDNGEKRLREAV